MATQELELTEEVMDELFLRGAVHEAGHAIVAHALGARVMGLGASSTGGGGCEIDMERKTRAHALVVLAGVTATNVWDKAKRDHNSRARWTGEERAHVIPGITALPGLPSQNGMSPKDIQGVEEYLRANIFYGASRKEELRELHNDAWDLVNELWQAIIAVAEALNDKAKSSDESVESELTEEQFLAVVEAQQ